MKKQALPGINIQYPISQLIASGEKTVETRTYPIPKRYVGTPVALIETPGPVGRFKARITAIIEFSESFEYETKESFYKDKSRHRVEPDAAWKWNPEQRKFGWPVRVLKVFSKPLPAPKRRGIVFSRHCEINAARYRGRT